MTSRSDWQARVMGCFSPRDRPPLGQWLTDHIRLPPNAAPWSRRAYPHLQAPGGPVDAYMREDVRTIWMQFATRLGKTTFGHGAMLYQAAIDPCPMLFGTATEGLVHKRVRNDVYPMIEMCEPLRDQLPPRAKRSQSRIDLRTCRIYCAWSGSTSSLSDLSARVCHASEIDKWEGDVGREADPLKLFDERSKDHPTHKRIKESTPTVKGRSRIEQGMAGSTAAHYFVPCPHCGTYQALEFGEPDSPAGVKWPKEIRDPGEVKAAAYYQCAHCGGRIDDHHRTRMMRDGVWAPDGCSVDGSGAVQGTPFRTGSDWGYQLSSLYALTLGWGDVAAEFIRSKDQPRDLRNFVNSWMAKTWEEYRSTTTEDQLADRLCEDRPFNEVPDDAVFLTAGIDRQQSHVVYIVAAWGLGARGWVIRYGTCRDFAELWATVLSAGVRNASGTLLHRIPVVLVDGGYETDETYQFCLRHCSSRQAVLPSKGMDSIKEESFRVTQHERAGGLPLVGLNTNYWQEVIQRAFDRLRPGDGGSISFPREAREDLDFLKQLVNEAPSEKKDTRGYEKRQWVKRWDSVPNDFRDCLRYARAAAEYYVGRMWGRLTPDRRALTTQPLVVVGDVANRPKPPSAARSDAPRSSFSLPDGRPFLASQRQR